MCEECDVQNVCIQKYSMCIHRMCVCAENYVKINNTCKKIKIVKAGYKINLLTIIIIGTITFMGGFIILTIVIAKRKLYNPNSGIDVEVSFYCNRLNWEAQI